MARTLQNLTSDLIDKTALAAMNTIASQVIDGELRGPEAASRLRRAARMVSDLRAKREALLGAPVRCKTANGRGEKRVLFILRVKPDGRWVLGTSQDKPVIYNADPRNWDVIERIELDEAA